MVSPEGGSGAAPRAAGVPTSRKNRPMRAVLITSITAGASVRLRNACRAPPGTWKTSPGRITIQRGSATEPASASASPDRLTYVSGSGWLWSGTTTPGGIVPRMVHGAPSPSSGRVRNSMIGPITSTPATVRGSTRYAVVMTISPLARMLDPRRPGRQPGATHGGTREPSGAARSPLAAILPAEVHPAVGLAPLGRGLLARAPAGAGGSGVAAAGGLAEGGPRAAGDRQRAGGEHDTEQAGQGHRATLPALRRFPHAPRLRPRPMFARKAHVRGGRARADADRARIGNSADEAVPHVK